jgi:hypothetical protein
VPIFNPASSFEPAKATYDERGISIEKRISSGLVPAGTKPLFAARDPFPNCRESQAGPLEFALEAPRNPKDPLHF